MLANKTEREKIIGYLKDDYNLVPGDTIYTKLVHCSRSGMYRAIDLYIMRDNKPLRISYNVGMILEGYDRRHEAAAAHGCGMDTGFHLAYNLGHVLFPKGFMCAGERCHSNDHSNGDRNREPHLHESGGYAFKHEWF